MIAYVDASVLLRIALGQPLALAQWAKVERAVSSALVQVECLRTMDRVRLQSRIDAAEFARRRAAVLALLQSLELIELDAIVLDRASLPMPTELGTLDALHLASALLWRETTGIDPVFATHDAALGVAALAQGFTVAGN